MGDGDWDGGIQEEFDSGTVVVNKHTKDNRNPVAEAHALSQVRGKCLLY